MNQLLLGASFPFVAGGIYYLVKKCRASFRALLVIPVLMLLSMLWAVIPDIPRILNHRELYHKLAQDPRCNIFYWHYSIDMSEIDSPLFSMGFAIIAAAILFAVWREIKLAERI